MTHLWRCRLFVFLLSSLVVPFVSAQHSFENTAIVRTVDLGGALVHVTTTYAVRSEKDGSQKYILALSEKEEENTHFMEAKVKGQSEVLSVERTGYDAER